MNVPSLEIVAALVFHAAQRLHLLFEYLGYMAGFFFVGWGCYQFYSCTKDRQRTASGATAYVISGISLIYLNKWYRAASLTFLGIDQTLMYAPVTDDWSTAMMAACLAIVQFLGLLALIRCWFLLRLVGSGELGRFALSRATVFFVAGVAAININQTVRVLFGTLGTTSPLG